MNTKEILVAAKAKIADPKHWTQYEYARDADGKPCSDANTSVCWCAIGALLTVIDEIDDAVSILQKAGRQFSKWQDDPVTIVKMSSLIAASQGIIYVNDQLGHDAVMKMYDKAIELADKELS